MTQWLIITKTSLFVYLVSLCVLWAKHFIQLYENIFGTTPRLWTFDLLQSLYKVGNAATNAPTAPPNTQTLAIS